MYLLDRFYDMFPDAQVAYLTGAREFVVKQWLTYLLIEPTIPFRLRIKKSAPPRKALPVLRSKTMGLLPFVRFRDSYRTEQAAIAFLDGKKQLKASVIFANLKPGQTQVLSGRRWVWGRFVSVSAWRLEDGELLIVVSPDSSSTVIS